MKKTNDTKVKQTWLKIGAMADAQIQKSEAIPLTLPQQSEPQKENSANKRKGKAKHDKNTS